MIRSLYRQYIMILRCSGEMKLEMDSGTKSEGEEDSQAFLGEKKTNLGRTPNHLTLSTTSTISAGSTGSQARLIQSSHQPENYQPITVKELGECIHYRYFSARLHRCLIAILKSRLLCPLFVIRTCFNSNDSNANNSYTKFDF